MSRGAEFILASYNQAASEVLTAREILNARLKNIIQQGAPLTFEYLAQTHNIETVRKFVPHVEAGFEYVKTRKNGGGIITLGSSAQSIRFTITDQGHFLNDMVVHIVLSGIGNPAGTNLYRFCDLPGIRLFQRVTLKINEVKIDEYCADDALFHEMHLRADEKYAWFSKVGQEEPKIGLFYFEDQHVNQVSFIRDGAQTLKPRQQSLHLWIPLLFWFNIDIGSSLRQLFFSTLQRYVDIELTPVNKIVMGVDGEGNPIEISSLNIESAELYTRVIYLNEEIADLLRRRKYPFSLIRTRRSVDTIINNQNGQIKLREIKYPIEYMLFGFRPLENESSFDHWHKFSKIELGELPVPALIENHIMPPQPPQLVARTLRYFSQILPVSQIGLCIRGNIIYHKFHAEFYSKYNNSFHEIMKSTDPGKMLISFALRAGGKQLTGHYNPSFSSDKSKESYIEYESNVDSSGNFILSSGARFHLVAYCLNFILFTEDSIMIKYT